MIYAYRISAVNCIEEKEPIRATGFCIANCYTEAMQRLSEYYGEDTIENLDLTLIGSSGEVVELCDGTEFDREEKSDKADRIIFAIKETEENHW